MATDVSAYGLKYVTTNFRTTDPTLSSESLSGRRLVRKIGGSRFSFTIRTTPMKYSTFMPFYGFIVGQRGGYGTFTVTPTDFSGGTSASSLGVAANVSAGGLTFTSTSDISVGTLIQFSNHTKAYIISGKSGSGTFTYTLNCPLRSAITTANTFDTNANVEMLVHLTNDLQQFDSDHRNLYVFEIDVEEVLV